MDERKRLVEKYKATKLARETIGLRIAKEFKDGDYVNLGRGLPVLAADAVDPSIDVFYHGEPGIMGYGTAIGLDDWELINANVHDAANRHVRPKPGMVFFDMGESFNMLRGKHLDASVLGGFEVSEKGDFANWALKYPVPHSGISVGGGFDLVVGPRKCIVAITHLDKHGASKLVKKLKYPLTGAPQHIDLVITDLAVVEIPGPKGNKEGMVLKEIAPGWTAEEVQTLTEASLKIDADVKVYSL
jgi:3-oxoacid CoA-transferase B subunit